MGIESNKIERYLKGKMPKEETVEFEKQIKSDKDLKNRLEEKRTAIIFDRLEKYIYLTNEIENYKSKIKDKL